ncbi:hypothetical protein HaLaN_32390, partial [Haematococcus lacustris]
MAGRVEEFEAALVQATEDIEEERRSDVIASMRSAAKWFEGREYHGRDGHKFVFVYDDMCHLL